MAGPRRKKRRTCFQPDSRATIGLVLPDDVDDGFVVSGTPDDDPFMAELMEALMTPLPQTGDRLIANGRPGTFVGRKPEAVTCQVTYIIDHDDGDRVEWVLNDWDRNKPEIVFEH
jgi:hypothetical protein